MDLRLLPLLLALTSSFTLCQGQHLKDNCLLDIAFVLDGSGSVTSHNWDLMLSFVNTFAAQADFASGGTRISVISFGNMATLNIGLGEHPDLGDFQSAVRGIGWKDQNTNTYSGIHMARTTVFNGDDVTDRVWVSDIMIVMTDGESTYDHEKTIPEADASRADGIRIYAIGIGDKIVDEELSGIADDPDEYFKLTVTDFGDLVRVVNYVVNATCYLQNETEPVLPTTTTTGSPHGGDIILDGCGAHDVTIIMDASGSIQADKFEKSKAFVKDVVASMTLGPGANQLALVQYSTQAHEILSLGEVSTHTELYAVIDSLNWLGSRTNTSGALRLTYRDIMSSENNREAADDIIILISDAESNTDETMTLPEAENARDQGIEIFTLGVGNKTSMAELLGVASKPSYWFLHLFSDFDDLADNGMDIINFLCAASYPGPVLEPSSPDCAANIAVLVDVPGLDPAVGQAMDSMMHQEDFWYGMQRLVDYTDLSANLGSPGGNSLVDQLAPLREEGVLGSEEGRNGHPVVILILGRDVWNDMDVARETVLLKAFGFRVLVVGVGQVEDGGGAILSSQPSASHYRHFDDVSVLLDPDTRMILRKDVCAATTSPRLSCDFEEEDGSMCGLVQEPSPSGLSWIQGEGETPSQLTGPQGAKSGDFYIYLESSNRLPGESVVGVLPFASDADKAFCLSFYYNMHGFHQGSLDVIVRSPSGRNALCWRLTGPHGEDWHFGQVLLKLKTNDVVAFRGTVGGGYSGDTALDAVTLQEGPCVGDTM